MIWTESCEHSILVLLDQHTLHILTQTFTWTRLGSLSFHARRLHSPPIAQSWNAFGAAIRSKSTLSLDLVELLVRLSLFSVISNVRPQGVRTDMQSRCSEWGRFRLVSSHSSHSRPCSVQSYQTPHVDNVPSPLKGANILPLLFKQGFLRPLSISSAQPQPSPFPPPPLTTSLKFTRPCSIMWII